MRTIKTFDLFSNCMLDNDFSYDIFFRMAVIEEYIKNNDEIWELYNKMQSIRASQIRQVPRYMIDHKDEFIKLINNFRQNGYDFEKPILINKNYLIIDGAHRMACALFFDVPEVAITFDENYYDFMPKEYSKKWFLDNNLQQCIEYAEKQRKKIYERWE